MKLKIGIHYIFRKEHSIQNKKKTFMNFQLACMHYIIKKTEISFEKRKRSKQYQRPSTYILFILLISLVLIVRACACAFSVHEY